MAGDTRGSDTVHTRYARKGTPTNGDELRQRGQLTSGEAVHAEFVGR